MKKLLTSVGLTSSYMVIASVVGSYLVYRAFTYLETQPAWAAAMFFFAAVTVVLNAYSFYRELPMVISEVKRTRRERQH